MDPRITTIKDAVAARIVDGTASGINGVGIDQDLEKLIVFYLDEEEAVKTLESLRRVDADKFDALDFLDVVVLEPGTPPEPPEDGDAVEGGGSGSLTLGEASQIDSALLAAASAGKIPLAPALVIRPRNGGRGRIGCFVESRSTKAVLTAVHIFHLRSEHDVLLRTSLPNNFDPIGKSWLFVNLKTGQGQSNPADGGLFLADMAKVTLQKDTRISGGFVDKSRLPGTERRLVTNLANDINGKVHDATSIISYDVVIDSVLVKDVVFVNQVLVKNQDEVFGQRGHSGSLVVMERSQADRGQALGLYSYTTAKRKYHYVTPFYACAKELGIDRIYNS